MKISVLLLFLFLTYSSYCQVSSLKFDEINQNENFSDSIKDIKFQKLLKAHYRNKEFDTLFNDTYMYMKWCRNKGNIDKSIELTRRNIFIMDSINYSDSIFYRRNIYSLGYYHKLINKLNIAIKYYDQVLEYKIDDKYALFSSFNIGIYFFNKEDYNLAANYFENSIQLARNLNITRYSTDASMYAAVCYRIMDTKQSVRTALDILNDEIEYVNTVYSIQNKRQQGYLSSLASLHRHLGTTYTDKEDMEIEKALFNFNIALGYANGLEEQYKIPRLYAIYSDIANLYAYQNDTISYVFFDKALLYQSSKISLNQLYDNKANLNKRLGQFENAKVNIQIALKSLSPNINSNFDSIGSAFNYLESKEKYQTIKSLLSKGEIILEESKFFKNQDSRLAFQALDVFEVTDDVLEYVRLESIEFKSKLFWRKLSSRLYTNAVKASLALDDYNKAFYFLEKNKALLLLEDVLLEGQKNLADIPEEISETHDQLRREVIKYESANDSLLRQKLVAKANYNKFIDSLDSQYKFYFKSIKPAELISLDSFQTSIKDSKQAYIEYILGEEDAYGMVITKDEMDLFSIPEVDSLRAQIEEFKSLLKTPITNLQDKEKYNALSYEIYKTLIPGQIQGILKGKDLTIIPDDVLLNIPFEALQTSEENNEYLIYKHQISYANSLTFLTQSQKQERENTKNAVGFAPVRFSKDLPTLDNSKTELEQLKLFEDPEIFLEEKATRQNLFKNMEDHKVVHISTHASSDKFRDPYLALNDSLININELYLAKNTADLVVLSACETANGELYKGEGVMSLSRSFFNTGAKSVASTLWSIDDKSSSEIMASFYRNLNDGESKSEALHHAKLDYLNSHDLSEVSPYYWASFVLVGDPSPIDFYQDYTIYYIILGLVMAFGLLLFFWKRKTAKTN